MNQSERVKMIKAYPRWIGTSRPVSERGKWKGAGRVYMKAKSLREWCREKGHSVEDVAEYMGVSVSRARDWFNGNGRPIYTRIVKLADWLNISTDQIDWDWKVEDISELPAMPRSPEFTPTKEKLLVSREQYEVAKKWLAAGRSKTEIAEAMGVSRYTYYKAELRFEADAPAKAKAQQKRREAAVKGRETQQVETQAAKPPTKPSSNRAGAKAVEPRRKATKAVQ